MRSRVRLFGFVATLPAGARVYGSGKAADGSPVDTAVNLMGQIDETLASLLSDLSQIVQLNCFLRPITAAFEVERAIAEFCGRGAPPMVFLITHQPQPKLGGGRVGAECARRHRRGGARDRPAGSGG